MYSETASLLLSETETSSFP